MSSILKSLRKIEEEKRDAAHVAPDLRVDQGFVPVKSKPLLPLLTGLALGAVIVGLFFLWPSRSTLPDVKDHSLVIVKDQSQTKVDQVGSAVKQAPTTDDVRQEEGVVVPVTANDSSQKSDADQSLKALVEPSKKSVAILPPKPVSDTDATNKIIPAPVSKPPVQETQAPDVSIAVSKPVDTTQIPSVATVTPTAPAVSPKLPEGVSLLVTEIFFQEDSANRMAVVNDLPVMIGTHVDSAIVTEILPDRVIFKLGGKTYTVISTNR